MAYSYGAAAISGATWGILVMGRRTCESLRRPVLPGRTLWVLSDIYGSRRKPVGCAYSLPGRRFWKALPEAQKSVFFAGRRFFAGLLELPSLERLYLSWVMVEVEGDTYFPPIPREWEVYRWEVFAAGPGVPIPFIFAEYPRKLP